MGRENGRELTEVAHEASAEMAQETGSRDENIDQDNDD